MKFTLLDSLFFMFVALKVKWLLSAYLSQEVQINYSAVITGVKKYETKDLLVQKPPSWEQTIFENQI